MLKLTEAANMKTDNAVSGEVAVKIAKRIRAGNEVRYTFSRATEPGTRFFVFVEYFADGSYCPGTVFGLKGAEDKFPVSRKDREFMLRHLMEVGLL